MKTLFVHGTGVRGVAYDDALAVIEQHLGGNSGVIPCRWGDLLGARLNANGASIPDYETTKGLAAVPQAELEMTLWELLLRDPLFELTALARASDELQGTFGSAPPAESLEQAVNALDMARIEAKLREAGLLPFFRAAMQLVTTSADYRDALFYYRTDDSLRAAVARALIAACIVLRENASENQVLPPATALCEELVEEIANQLRGESKSIGGWILGRIGGLAIRAGLIDQLRRKRGAITDATFPASGDILLYQSSAGAAIRDFIFEQIRDLDEPVTIMAHSLGGIASVDLLVLRHIPNVKLLITVGSQVPYLYELNALHSLRYGEPLPPHFPRWLNVYDRRDLLSFIGAPLFPGRIEDVCVDNRMPFPRSHSGYWSNAATWKAVLERLPA